jgi:hypothetical protein
MRQIYIVKVVSGERGRWYHFITTTCAIIGGVNSTVCPASSTAHLLLATAILRRLKTRDR